MEVGWGEIATDGFIAVMLFFPLLQASIIHSTQTVRKKVRFGLLFLLCFCFLFMFD